MASISKSFTAAGVGNALLVGFGDSFDYEISGTFVGTAKLERSENGGASWEVISSHTGAASGTFFVQNRTRGNEVFRWHCTAFTSGTIVTSLADVASVLQEFKGADGSTIFSTTDDGIDLAGKSVTGLGTPSVDSDAATKEYVDDAIDSLVMADEATIKSTVVSDVAYDEGTWNGVTDVAPSKNAVRDQVQAILGGTAPFIGELNINLGTPSSPAGGNGIVLNTEGAIGDETGLYIKTEGSVESVQSTFANWGGAGPGLWLGTVSDHLVTFYRNNVDSFRILADNVTEFLFPVKLKGYAVLSLPDATTMEGAIIYVSDEAGGKTLAFSDGTNWRRAQDRVIVS